MVRELVLQGTGVGSSLGLSRDKLKFSEAFIIVRDDNDDDIKDFVLHGIKVGVTKSNVLIDQGTLVVCSFDYPSIYY